MKLEIDLQNCYGIGALNHEVGEGSIGADPQINGEGSDCFFGWNYYICSGVGVDWLCHRPIPTGKWERCGAIRPFYGGDRPCDGCSGDYRILCEFIGSRQRKKGDFLKSGGL